MEIENNTLLIVPNNLKKTVLKKIKKLVNFKIMSLEEFIKSYFYDYDEEAIYYLMKKYNYKYEVALTYLRNLYYIDDKKYNIEKLDKLVSIKEELDDNKLLKYDNLFKKTISKKTIVVYGYDYIETKHKQLLDSLNAKYINDNNIYNNAKLYEFKDKDEEIDFLISKIVELKELGVSLNRIKIVKNEYQNRIIDRLKLYNIHTQDKISLYGTNIVNIFLDNLDNTKENILSIIEEKVDLNNELNFKIYNKLINIVNKYTFIDKMIDIKDMLIYDFKHTSVKINYQEQIEFITLENNIIEPDNYVFLLGFNIGIYPNLKKDEEYITDNIKEHVSIDKVETINKKIKQSLVKRIKKTNNMIITYKTKEECDYFVSTLNEELKLKPIKNYKIPYYIKLDNKIKLAKKLDLLNKYNYIDKDLALLYNNYKDIPYNTYDNKFSGINRSINSLLLSYSSMDTYYKCGFKYYIENVLKLNIYEENFANIIGNIFHYVLSKAFRDNFSFEQTYNEYLDKLNKEFTNKEIVFLDKLKEDLKLIIETINKQLELISLDNTLYEQEIIVNRNSKVKFKGFIDKLMYKEYNNNTLVAIIDYKTGNPNLNLNNNIYGLDLQLPVYLYLTKNSKLKNVEVLGFYLQKILNNEINIDIKKTYLEQKEDNLKLQGYSIDDTNLIEKFDKSYMDSRLVKGLKISKSGSFYSNSKVLSKHQIDKLIELVDNKIEEASNNIINNKFDIDPKSINGKNVSCVFCKYKDICYMKEEDVKKLKEYKELEFLV